MADKHPKRPRDFSQAAKLVVDIASGQVEDRERTPEEQGKDPAAVSLGRRGGLKGGEARAKKLTRPLGFKPTSLSAARNNSALRPGASYL
jgi:hypothetical protein